MLLSTTIVLKLTEQPETVYEESYVSNTAGMSMPDSYVGEGYYGNQLKGKYKEVYQQLYSGYENFKKDIDITPVTEDEVNQIYKLLTLDNKGIVAVRGLTYSKFDYEKVVRVSPIYALTKEERDQKWNEVEEKAEEIFEELDLYNPSLSADNKVLRIHDYLAMNTVYDNEGTKDEIYDYFRDCWGTLILGRANCAGYATTFNYLLNKAGIQSERVLGYVHPQEKAENRGYHTWNVINTGADWRMYDVCFDDWNGTWGYDVVYNHYNRDTRNLDDDRIEEVIPYVNIEYPHSSQEAIREIDAEQLN